VFADAKEINPDRIGENRLIDQAPDDFCMRTQVPIGPRGYVTERIQAEVNGPPHVFPVRAELRR
jgi:hypothetical protein